MAGLKFCTMCLVTNVKMRVLTAPNLLFYYNILESPVNTNQARFACYECDYYLQKYREFYEKCNTAHNILSQMFAVNTKIIYVDRKRTKLESKLTITSPVIHSLEYELTIDCKNEDKTLYEGSEVSINKEETINNIDNKILNVTEDAVKSEEFLNNSAISLFKDHEEHETNNQKECQMNTRKASSVRDDIEILDKNEEVISLSDMDDDPFANDDLEHEDEAKDKKKKMHPKFNKNFFEGYTTVVFMTPEEAKQEVLLRKESNNYKHCPFKCDLCFRGFGVQITFENHMKKHSPEYGEHKCEFCHLRFPKSRILYKHHLSCHKQKFYCKICPYICFASPQARSHVRLHKGKKYPCNECGEVFSMPNSLFMHKRIKHTAEVVCELCGGMYVTQKGLLLHKRLSHRQENNELKGPRCEDCNVQFATETAWKRHLVLSSKHKVSNGCEHCGETFADEEVLKEHVKAHGRTQINRNIIKVPAACDMCGEWLASRDEYKSHMNKSHPQSEAAKKLEANGEKQCVCEFCGKMYRKQFLPYHLHKHTGERPYKCRECGKTFATPGTINAHRATHRPKTRDKKYRCDLCGKLYTQKTALSKHVKIHLGIRPHKCPMCEKSFVHPSEVKLHVKYTHYKVPWPKRDRSKRKKIESPPELK